jgi:hypothetical protein
VRGYALGTRLLVCSALATHLGEGILQSYELNLPFRKSDPDREAQGPDNGICNFILRAMSARMRMAS